MTSPTKPAVLLAIAAATAVSANAQIEIGERVADDLRIIGPAGCSHGTAAERAAGAAVLAEASARLGDPGRQLVGFNRERSGGFDIIYDLSPAVAANPDFVAALERAAQRWEALIHDEVNVLYAVDFTSNQGFIAAAGSTAFLIGPYGAVVNAFQAKAGPDIATYINAIPTTPADFFTDFGVQTDPAYQPNDTLAVLKMWGAAEPLDISQVDGSIVLNTDFTFDTDLSDGVSPGTIDLESVMVHELGHVFGFRSGVDSQGSPTTLDQFRFGFGGAPNDPSSLANISDPGFDRESRTGVEAALDTVDAVPGYEGEVFRFSTGRNAPGDGRQASHWKADELLGINPPIGVMDPTAPLDALAGVGFFTNADKLAFRLVGWNIDLGVAPACIGDVTTINTNPGDADYGVPDGSADGADLSFFVEFWLANDPAVADLTTLNTNPGDANYGVPDGSVDGADLSFFIEAWLAGCV